jgi:hypothetical protein
MLLVVNNMAMLLLKTRRVRSLLLGYDEFLLNFGFFLIFNNGQVSIFTYKFWPISGPAEVL